MTFVSDLEPRALWAHFDRILTIPRGSKEEERIREYVIAVAASHGLRHRTDASGNVVVTKPGSPGHESAPSTVLQAHLDMVQEKNSNVDHDWATDPIKPRMDGEYMTASGTTLGSDCGVGVAAMLAVMESTDIAHGPLEFLFTIDEETGLTGAQGLDTDMLEGRRLINLDSEEEGVLTVGCAGGADSKLSLPLHRAPAPPGSTALTVKLSGLKGGHSGVDIHLQRGNAIQLLARMLHAGSLQGPFYLAEFEGGNKHNAIPREAHATVVLARDRYAGFTADLANRFAAIQEEFSAADPNMRMGISDAEVPVEVWDQATSRKVLQLVVGLPHGVQSMSYDIPGLVETSTNLATVGERGDSLKVLLSSRSSVESALGALRAKIRAVAGLAGAEVEEGDGYPGWKPDLDSRLLAVVTELHESELGKHPEVGAVHAGLECGIIGERVPGMDMISFGPQIEFPHSPDERVRVPSVADFYRLLTATLERLGKK
jgi:dipeptidase D